MPVVKDNVEQVADALEELTEDIEDFEASDIDDIAVTMKNIVNVGSSSANVSVYSAPTE